MRVHDGIPKERAHAFHPHQMVFRALSILCTCRGARVELSIMLQEEQCCMSPEESRCPHLAHRIDRQREKKRWPEERCRHSTPMRSLLVPKSSYRQMHRQRRDVAVDDGPNETNGVPQNPLSPAMYTPCGTRSIQPASIRHRHDSRDAPYSVSIGQDTGLLLSQVCKRLGQH
jgi:hypothetical protein